MAPKEDLYRIERYIDEIDSPRPLPRWLKLALFLAAVCMASSVGLLTADVRAAHAGRLPFSGVTCVFLSELIKLVLSVTMQLAGGHTVLQRPNWMYVVPGVLYMVVDNMYFLIVRFISPATQTLLWNAKIIWTALLVRWILKMVVTARQWAALGVLVAALLIAKADKSVKMLGPQSADAVPFVVGALLCMLGTMMVSCGNVLTEWLMKQSPSQTLHWQNIQLYSFGIVFSFGALLTEVAGKGSWGERAGGVFEGFELKTWLIVLLGSLSGILSGALFKYLDNVVFLYVHVCSMFVISLGSWMCFAFELRWNFVCGLVLASVSMVLYFNSQPSVAPTGTDAAQGAKMTYFTVADDLDDAFGALEVENAEMYAEDAPFLLETL